MSITEFTAWYQENESRLIAQLEQFLRFRSVSSDLTAREDCLDCAAWLMADLQRMGFTVKLLETEGLPVLRASYLCPQATKTLLYYGHYDVYEAGNITAWDSDPFIPLIKNNRIYARGAQDNKGQTFYFLKALECLQQRSEIGINIEIILDGEEETTTSESLRSLLPELKKDLAADFLLICDTDSASASLPTIVLGLRGILSMSVEYCNSRGDLHSGYGGSEKNAATCLALALSQLSDIQGRAKLPGYQPLVELSAREQELFDKLVVKIAQLKNLPDTEQLKACLLAKGFFSSIDISALEVGVFEQVVKTVIPAQARAQITSRLIPGQCPEQCLELLEQHFAANCPAGLDFRVLSKTSSASGVRFNPDSAVLRAAAEVLCEVSGAPEVLYDWEGSSIPFVSWAVPSMAPEAVIVGFGLEEDAVHAANESFSLDQLRQGFLYCCRFLEKLGK